MANYTVQDYDRYDVAIVGGGAYGAALAYEAASRGLKTFLAEKGDFGSGTSANSLKIVHGGLRYLQNLDFARARSSALERSVLMRIAPSLVRPQKFVLPTGWKRGNGRVVMGLGLAVNALLTTGRNHALAASHRIGAGQILNREQLRSLVPTINLADVSGGAVWHDGVMTDSERLCLAFVMSARDHGATTRNYTRAERVLCSGGVAQGLAVRDVITGEEDEVSARVVISCQGPWAHTDQDPLFGSIRSAGVLKAVNLVLPNTNLQCGVGFPARDKDGRAMGGRLLFAVPWNRLTMTGTWYFGTTKHSDELSLRDEELEMMLRDLNSGFDNWRFEPADILAAHIGQLPIDPKDPTRSTPISKPVIGQASQQGAEKRSWIVQGEKWTTARQTAKKALDVISAQENLGASPSVSASSLLNTGCEAYADDGRVGPDASVAPTALPDALEKHLICSLRNEQVRTLPDLVFRRTNIASGGLPSDILLREIADLAASELGWSTEARQSNLDATYQHGKLFCMARSGVDEPRTNENIG